MKVTRSVARSPSTYASGRYRRSSSNSWRSASSSARNASLSLVAMLLVPAIISGTRRPAATLPFRHDAGDRRLHPAAGADRRRRLGRERRADLPRRQRALGESQHRAGGDATRLRGGPRARLALLLGEAAQGEDRGPE